MSDLMPHISLWEPLLVNKVENLLLSLFYKEINGFLHEVPHLSLNFYISDNLYIIIYIYKSWFVNDWLVYNLLLTVIINSWNNTKYNETQTHYQFTLLFCIHPNFCKIHANNCNHIKKVKFISMLQIVDKMKAITNKEMGTYCPMVGGSWKQ